MVKDTTMPIPASPNVPPGLPLVFVPGLNCTADLFAPQVAAFGHSHPITIADHASDDTVSAMARRLLAAAPPRFALAGLALGSYVALEVMRLAPQRVDRLALVGARASADLPEEREIVETMIKMAQIGRFDDLHQASWSRLVHMGRLGDVALEGLVRSMAEKTGPARYIRQQRASTARPGYEPLLSGIRCRTVVICGDDDALSPRFMSEDLADGIRGAELVFVPECGHLSTIERPEAVNAALGSWLAA